MSDDLDRFVLQYQVETRDAIKRLEELANRTEKVNKGSGESVKGFGRFSKAASELNSALPSSVQRLGGLASNFGKIGIAGGAAAAGVVAVAAAMKLASNEAAKLNEQRLLAMKLGTTGLSLESFGRGMNVASGGKVSAAQASDIYGKIAQMGMSAYTNPFQMNREAFLLRGAGVDINNSRGGIAGTDSQVSQLSRRMHDMSAEQAQALGQLIGLQQDEVNALRNLNGATNDVANMTNEQALAYLQAQQAAQRLQGAQGLMTEQWRELEITLGGPLMDATGHFLGWINDLIHTLGKASADMAAPAVAPSAKPTGDGSFMGWLENISNMSTLQYQEEGYTKAVNAGAPSAPNENAGKQARDAEAAAAKAEVLARQKSDELFAQSVREQDAAFERNMALFAQSVNTFSGVIDERAAWASWAGEIGRAANLPGATQDKGDTGKVTYNAGAVLGAYGPNAKGSASEDHGQYDAIYKEAAAKYADLGVTVERLKQITAAESRFDPKAVSSTGAQGLMQILPSNDKALGITDAFDPRQNILAGARLYAEGLKRWKGNETRALLDYHSGPNPTKWNDDASVAYPGLVTRQAVSADGTRNKPSASGNPMITTNTLQDAWNPKAAPTWTFSGGVQTGDMRHRGEGRDTIQRNQVAQMLAGDLHAPLAQLQRGGINRGDVAWAASERETKLLNDMATLRGKMNTPGMLLPNQLGQAQRDLQTTMMNLSQLQAYAPQLIGQSQDGDRNLTRGQMRQPVVNADVTINVSGAQDPHAVGYAIRDELRSHFVEITHGMADGMQY